MAKKVSIIYLTFNIVHYKYHVNFILVSISALTRMGVDLVTAKATLVGLCSFLKVTLTGKSVSSSSDSCFFLYLYIHMYACIRYVQIGVASFGSLDSCASKPGGYSRLTFDVIQWIKKVKESP